MYGPRARTMAWLTRVQRDQRRLRRLTRFGFSARVAVEPRSAVPDPYLGKCLHIDMHYAKIDSWPTDKEWEAGAGAGAG